MHVLDPVYQQSIFIQNTSCGDNLSVVYGSSDFDDSIASQTQMQDTVSSKQYMQEQFRMVAENMQESGNIIYLFG